MSISFALVALDVSEVLFGACRRIVSGKVSRALLSWNFVAILLFFSFQEYSGLVSLLPLLCSFEGPFSIDDAERSQEWGRSVVGSMRSVLRTVVTKRFTQWQE